MGKLLKLSTIGLLLFVIFPILVNNSNKAQGANGAWYVGDGATSDTYVTYTMVLFI